MKRRAKGAALSEFAAVLVIAGPLLIILLYAAVEICTAFAIKSALDMCARNAARALIVAYNNHDPRVLSGATPSNSASRTFCDTNFQMRQYVKSGCNQWTVAWDTNNPPNYVQVTCSYPNGGVAGSLPRFPNPDVFNLGSTFVLQSTFTMPRQ
jgi:Flp pilus assembly protein TadG